MGSVAPDEVLYRRVPSGKDFCTKNPDGTIQINSFAFAERNNQPSVFRAVLCQSNPTFVKENDSDGVASLIVREVESIPLTANDKNGKPMTTYRVKVEADPLQPHEARPEIINAHAIIVLDPSLWNTSVKRKFCIALARLANARSWEIVPQVEE